jgi:hypothetical protein
MCPFAFVSLRRTWVFAVGFFLLSAAGVGNDASRPLSAQPVGNHRNVRTELLPSFEPNLGQADPRVKFLSRGRGYTLFLTKDEAVLAIQKPEVRSQKPGVRSHSAPRSVLRLRLLGASAAGKVAGLDELPGKSNYFIGNDPKEWRTKVPTYGKVRYESVYPGVDLVYYGNQSGQLECDFVVAPGADPRAIRWAIDAERQVGSRQKAADSTQSEIQNRKSKIGPSLRIAPNGDLIVALPGGELRFHKPVVYQTESIVDSRQSTVESTALLDNSRFKISSVRLKLEQIQLLNEIHIFGFVGKVEKPL